MFFFNEFQKKKLEYDRINLSFTKKITKLDKKIFNLIYSQYQLLKKENIILSLEQVIKLGSFNSIEELNDYFKKIPAKKIEYNLCNKNNSFINGSFPIISSYFIENNNLILFLSKETLLSFENNNFFNYIDIFGIIGFENNYSLDIFLEIINSNNLKEQGELFLKLDDFKKLLCIENLYSRFYDLERKVLKPIIFDFNSNSRYTVILEKVKEGVSQSHKILGIKLSYTDKVLENSRLNVNNLMFKIRDKINDYNFVFNLISDNLKLKNYDYVKSNVIYALKNHKKEIFDAYLAKALKDDYYNLYGKSETSNQTVTEVTVHSTSNLYNEIYNILNKMGLKDITEDGNFHSLFYRTIYNLIDKKVYIMEHTCNSLLIKITVEYYSTYKSIITVRKQNIL